MSLIDRFSNKTLCVALAPGQLTALVRSGKRIYGDSAVRIALDDAQGHWQGALAALENFLAQGGAAIKGLPLSLSLSNRWCQLAMLPWSEALANPEASERFVQAQFAGLFGDGARDWTATCDDAPYGEPRLACAVERVLLDDAQRVAALYGHRCIGVEAALALAWRASAAPRPDAFAVVEQGRIVLAAAQAGRIVAVHAQACHGDWRAELAHGWRRWTLRMPHLTHIDSVAVICLDGTVSAPLPDGFHAAALAATSLGPEFAAVCMVGS